ncbi:hypothetical protein BDD12DRAFT_148220 [Trichophaea hybrida]|nr:hypothetical protein BDD12DRAFT_148220 [Trichophaea hybrida]
MIEWVTLPINPCALPLSDRSVTLLPSTNSTIHRLHLHIHHCINNPVAHLTPLVVANQKKTFNTITSPPSIVQDVPTHLTPSSIDSTFLQQNTACLLSVLTNPRIPIPASSTARLNYEQLVLILHTLRLVHLALSVRVSDRSFYLSLLFF